MKQTNIHRVQYAELMNVIEDGTHTVMNVL
jgi:hypothetical protein